MVRVLHVTESVQGGVASFLDELGYAMKLENPEIEFILAGCADQLQFLEALHASEIVALPSRNRSILGLFSYVAEVVKLLIRIDADVIHAHSSFAGLAVRVAKLLCQDSRPVVYSPHGWSFAMEVGHMRRSAFAHVERLLVPLTAQTVCQSETELKLAREFGFRDNLCAIPNGIRTATFCPESFAKLDAPDAKLKVLFVGRFDRQKGFDIVLEAAGALLAADIHVLAVGGYVIDQGNVLPPGNVTLAGWVDRSALAPYFEWCDAVVMPSRWEAFGLVAIEAMRAAKPILASDRGALPELISHGQTGLIFGSPTAAALVECIQSLDLSMLPTMGRKAALHFQMNYDARVMSQSYAETYYRAIGNSR